MGRPRKRPRERDGEDTTITPMNGMHDTSLATTQESEVSGGAPGPSTVQSSDILNKDATGTSMWDNDQVMESGMDLPTDWDVMHNDRNALDGAYQATYTIDGGEVNATTIDQSNGEAPLLPSVDLLDVSSTLNYSSTFESERPKDARSRIV
ncbi:MAG: hypothetical protein Q9170_004473 [Blastenia crenularia]